MRMRIDEDNYFRQGIGVKGRRHNTFRANETERQRAVSENRICQNADTVMPEQQQRMPDPGRISAIHIGRQDLCRIV